jgi:peptidoglycan/LPS O-acetylase OafA/YrhL
LIFYTPLHIFWAGPEFVAVFFVLSGFVLALPVIRGGRLRRTKYYPSRLLRLYIPVWGALVLAAVLHIIVSHQVIPSASPWLNVHSTPLTWHALVQDMLLGPHVGDWGFNTVLWSLYWIVLFSLLLPILLIVPFASRIARIVVAALCFYVLYHGSSAYSLYLPPFVLGVVLAFERDAIEHLALRLRGRGVMSLTTKFGLGAACISLLTVDRWISYTRTTLTLVVVGACMSVICAQVIPSVRRWFETHPMQWVGRRAFSLYLVHEPLLVAIAFALGASLAPVPFVILVAIAALVVCALFFRWVEVPSHRLARNAGAWCDQNL